MRQAPLVTTSTHPMRFAILLGLFVTLIAGPSAALIAGPTEASGDEFFEKSIRPLLVKRCIECHGPNAQQGGLRLDSRSGWVSGGKRGAAIQPGDSGKSLLIRALHGDGVPRMPPAGALGDREVATLTRWVRQGARDPRTTASERIGGLTVEAARSWWSLQPVRRPVLPANRGGTPIDGFLEARLAAKGIRPNPAADRRTLLRRVTYDLSGLPPTPEETDAFLADGAPGAYERVVDRLLASPRYGERWGRHWLDLVRYADTAGENSDHPLPHAWRYRNWVIDAFNANKPYNEFLREQIAGDLIAPKGPMDQYGPRIVATGFLALARRFGHEIDKDLHLTHEDGIDTLGKAFLGLTVGCARCHDHKYDPITAKDYYGLYGIFASTKLSFPGCEPEQQPRDLVPLIPDAEWDRRTQPQRQALALLDARLAQQAGTTDKARQTFGSPLTRSPLATEVVPDAGERPIALSEVEVRAGELLLLSILPQANHGADTTQLELEIDEIGGVGRRWNLTADALLNLTASNPLPDGGKRERAWWFFDGRQGLSLLPEPVRDQNGTAGLHSWRNGETPMVFVNSNAQPVTVWTTLPPRSFFVHPGPEGPVAVGWASPLTGRVRVRGRVRDAHPGGDGVAWRLDRLDAALQPALGVLADAQAARTSLTQERSKLLAVMPQREVAFAVSERPAADARVHERGDPQQLGETVPRRWLTILGGTPVRVRTSSGRLELADWVASPKNPLTARVMVNRLWLHHFGRGLVRTPNDFGTRGDRPTHPELLDWLASEFMESGWDVKRMHRLIVLSRAYRQSSAATGASVMRDPTNALYWRFDRRRLTAEELRDSLIFTSGELDPTPGGPHPFPPEATWRFSQHEPFSAVYETNRRSVYLVQLRNRRHPFLGLFDGADPNASTPQRQTTTVPTQALYFMNDPFFHAQSAALARRAKGEPDGIDRLYRSAFQRTPSAEERAFATQFVARYERDSQEVTVAERPEQAWAALARILLATNELLYLD